MLLSRVADSIYWMSRYLERAENIVRLLEVNLQRMLDLPQSEETEWEPLVAVMGDLEFFRQRYGRATRQNVIQFLVFDHDYANSIASCLTVARENARSIREVLSSELWQEINRFYLKVHMAQAQNEAQHHSAHFFEQLRLSGYLCNGLCEFTMLHNDCWHFSQVGRLLERADKTARILDLKYFILLPKPEDVGKPLDIMHWSAILTSASALEMHRRCHREITPATVAEFLILDRSFPRSIYYSLKLAEVSLNQITGAHSGTFTNLAEQQLGALRSKLAYSRIEDIIDVGLHQYLECLQARLNRIDNAIFEIYFDRSSHVQRQLAEVAQ